MNDVDQRGLHGFRIGSRSARQPRSAHKSSHSIGTWERAHHPVAVCRAVRVPRARSGLGPLLSQKFIRCDQSYSRFDAFFGVLSFDMSSLVVCGSAVRWILIEAHFAVIFRIDPIVFCTFSKFDTNRYRFCVDWERVDRNPITPRSAAQAVAHPRTQCILLLLHQLLFWNADFIESFRARWDSHKVDANRTSLHANWISFEFRTIGRMFDVRDNWSTFELIWFGIDITSNNPKGVLLSMHSPL